MLVLVPVPVLVLVPVPVSQPLAGAVLRVLAMGQLYSPERYMSRSRGSFALTPPLQ